MGQAVGKEELGVSGVQVSQSQPWQLLPFGPRVPGATREDAGESVAVLSPPVFLWSIQVVQPTWGKVSG